MSKPVAVSRTIRTAAFMVLVPVVVLAGCTNLKIKMGMRMNVATLPVNSMEVSVAKSQGVAPGQKKPLVVTFKAADGRVWLTEGAGSGSIMWQDLTVTSTVVSVNGSGEVSLPRDPRLSDGKTGHVVVTVPSHADLRAETDISLRYDLKYYADFSGSKGIDGTSGISGTDGMRGTDGSFDPAHPSAGGNGSDGGNGTSGMNGSAGGDGTDVEIWLAPHPGDSKLIEVGVQPKRGKETFYLIDPNGGTLSVSADGGQGGSGGKGGRGGRGGAGGSGSPSGMSGHDGTDGQNGFDGRSGSGGAVTVVYDPAIAPYLNVLHISNSGGSRPVFESRRLNPLW